MNLVKTMQQLARRHSLWEVWQDFIFMSAVSIANAVDHRAIREEREQQYLRTAAKYSADELQLICQALSEVMTALETPQDILGQTFMALELGNKWAGQFFTPDCVCQLMASMIVDEGFCDFIRQNGFATLSEPSVGGGAMVIALVKAVHEAGLNPQQCIHVTAVDVDIKAVHMTYIQLSLLGIPAVIVHGNTLTAEEWDHWYTPMHILFGWTARLAAQKPHSSIPVPHVDTTKLVQVDLFAEEVAA